MVLKCVVLKDYRKLEKQMDSRMKVSPSLKQSLVTACVFVTVISDSLRSIIVHVATR